MGLRPLARRRGLWSCPNEYRWRWSKERYVAIKISTSHRAARNSAAENELDILQHISRANPHHKGWHFVRRLLDSFAIDGVSGTHLCLVLEPLREPLWLYCKRFVDGVIPSDLLKIIVRMILHGLDYLHSECRVIHTGIISLYFICSCMSNNRIDLKPDNVLVKIEDPGILERDALDEYDNPLPQKVMDDRTIYLSRNNYGPFAVPAGLIQISDFGFSVSGTIAQSGCIQAELYRAPEVVLDAGFTYSADIWSLGVMVWFPGRDHVAFHMLIPRRSSYGTCLKGRSCSIQSICKRATTTMIRHIWPK